MTLTELATRCDEVEAYYQRHGLTGEPSFTLKVPGTKWGRRARIVPGLMGDVLNNCLVGETLVSVKVPAVRKWLARVALGGGEAE